MHPNSPSRHPIRYLRGSVPSSVRASRIGEASDREAGIVDEHVNSSVIANHGAHELGHGFDLSNIERAHIDAVRNLRRGCRLLNPLAFS